MAKNKNIVYGFIDELIEPSFNTARKELDEISKYAKEIDGIADIKAYDVFYYGEKYKFFPNRGYIRSKFNNRCALTTCHKYFSIGAKIISAHLYDKDGDYYHPREDTGKDFWICRKHSKNY